MFRSARAAYIVLLVAVLAAGGGFAYFHLVERPAPAPPVDPQPEKPAGKLVVLVVFDQMRGDYPARWAPHFGPGGFERMKKEGVWYAAAQVPYSCTSTGP